MERRMEMVEAYTKASTAANRKHYDVLLPCDHLPSESAKPKS
jgi:hypothetical protein